MPRVRIKAKDYAIADMRRWLIGELASHGFTQTDVAGWLGMSQPSVAEKIKKMNFRLEEMMEIFDRLATSPETIGKLMKVRRN